MQGATHMTTVDAISFFHQFNIMEKDRYKVIVSTHRGQEIFNVVVIGFRNSVAYIQRVLDGKLRRCRKFYRVYINNIVIQTNGSLQDHLNALREVFQLLIEANIKLLAKKLFIRYLLVQLLGQRVDALGLLTPTEKLEAIAKLSFPKTLRQLKHYLGLTRYLRQFIPRYTAIMEPLQRRKTILNAALRIKIATDQKRKHSKISRAILEKLTQEELELFHKLQ